MAAPNKGEPAKAVPKLEPIAPKSAPLDHDFRALEAMVQAHAIEAEKLAHAAFKRGDVQLHAYYNALANALGTVSQVFRGRKG
ncbi:hypothetical protein [Acidiferrobacter sp.]|uniref:hypothetical protein n=1 Tax=Acidiferrobacter sp. TaxID=1872107 RepID=UPI00262EFFC8|nr:hypothetical protein [Acidiferrobacter sp.]